MQIDGFSQLAVLSPNKRNLTGAVTWKSTAIARQLFAEAPLFPGGVGKTTSPETFTSPIDDVETRIFAELPDDTWFYPGHGDDSTSGRERPHLAEWRARGW